MRMFTPEKRGMNRGYQIVRPGNAFEAVMRRLKQFAHHLVLFLPAVCAVAAHGSPPIDDMDVIQGEMVFDERDFVRHLGTFQMLERHLGESRAPEHNERPAQVAGASIAALPDGGALVVDPDSGGLARLDKDQETVARLKIGPGVAQVVVDRKAEKAYVADRMGDRIVVVTLARSGLKKERAFDTVVEPFGLALTPDGKTLLVTGVVDGELAAHDTATGKIAWRSHVGREPRGVAISPDGTEAMVASLVTGTAARVTLSDGAVDLIAINPPAPVTSPTTPQVTADAGREFARNAFAALYLGNGVAVIGHQVSKPNQVTNMFQEARGTYGGGFAPPIAHRLTFFKDDALASAHVQTHQPRAMAYDAASDVLYVAGYGSDDIVSIADVSQAGVRPGWATTVVADGAECGPNGLAVADDGTLLVSCELTRKVARVKHKGQNAFEIAMSKELFETRLTKDQLEGRALFRDGNNPQLSLGGAMACASCHAEGRTDGLSWRIEGHDLQTPLLAGRVAGTHPFKWDGKDGTIKDSVKNTVVRLGGGGITEEQARDLIAFIESMPRPRAPERDAKAVARGKKLFESDTTGCASCHGGPTLSDGKKHDLALDIKGVDTPSLIGLALSAPYFHDGSAPTLRSAMLENGSIHGMGSTSKLDDKQLGDLITYLETL